MAAARSAIHICADVLTTEPYARWATLVAARDAIETTERLCRAAGILEHHRLVGEAATREALRRTLVEVQHADELVLVFSGHTERGRGPIESTAWCFADGPFSVAEVAARLAELPATTAITILVDSCYAAAITHVLAGPQPCVVIAACDDEQTMTERIRSALLVRLEAVLPDARDLDALRAALIHDTPDAERPVVWQNAAATARYDNGAASAIDTLRDAAAARLPARAAG